MNYELPKNYWKERDPKGRKMEKDKLRQTIEEYIAAHNVMALATARDAAVRNTPVEYEYYAGAFWFLSEGGKKFDGLEVNKNVCLAIFDQMERGVCRGLQVTGTAQVIEPDDPEYLAHFQRRGLSPNAFSKRVPYPIPLVKVEVREFDYFDGALGRENYYVRQHLEV